MKSKWKDKELILALNLYYKIPFSKIHYSHPEIVKLSNLINRTPSAVALKLVNFARLDPALKVRKISGMKHGAKVDEEIWNEYYNNLEKLAYESELILAEYKNKPVELVSGIDTTYLPKEGKEREKMIKTRVNQQFFRCAILAAYENKCCITNLNIPSLLVASHIIPWSKDPSNRMNLSNGLCLNPLHDKAFDLGLITVTQSYKVKLSPSIYRSCDSQAKEFLILFDGKEINLPYKYHPDKKFLEYHNINIFQR
jgi:predicted restriction endonuclease